LSFLSDPPLEPDPDFELPESLLESLLEEELPELSFDLPSPDEPSPDEPFDPFDPLAEAPAATVLDPVRLSVR
jgi:hypothetical protein